MASTAIRVVNHSPYIVTVRATVHACYWADWAVIKVAARSDAFIGTEWWWYDLYASLDAQQWEQLKATRKKYVDAYRAQLADSINVESYSVSTQPKQSWLRGQYGNATVNIRPSDVDEYYTNIARKTDPSATLYKWYPPVRFDGGRDID